MKTLIILISLVFLTGCQTLSELFEGDFDNQEEYEMAVDQVINEYNISDESKAALRQELYPLRDKLQGVADDYDELRESLKIRIVQRILSAE